MDPELVEQMLVGISLLDSHKWLIPYHLNNFRNLATGDTNWSSLFGTLPIQTSPASLTLLIPHQGLAMHTLFTSTVGIAFSLNLALLDYLTSSFLVGFDGQTMV